MNRWRVDPSGSYLIGNAAMTEQGMTLSDTSPSTATRAHRTTLGAYVLVTLKGVAMGAADVVPGVSGGTIAFITGIYEELLASLRSITPGTLSLLWRADERGQRGIPAVWHAVNGNFLVALLAGIAFSLLSLARVISYCLEHYPVLVWAFFFGLIIASAIYMVRQLQGVGWREWLALGIGVAFALGVSVAKPVELPGEWWMVFLAGSLAICAMILPGISGSFILVLLGMYPVFLNALKSLDLVILGFFAAGCACGLLLFSHLLHWLLQRFHNMTLAVLIGFLLGSLNIIWPWKHTLETMVNRHGETVPLVQENVLPGTYSALVGAEPYTLVAGVLAVSGMVLVLGLEWVAVKLEKVGKSDS